MDVSDAAGAHLRRHKDYLMHRAFRKAVDRDAVVLFAGQCLTAAGRVELWGEWPATATSAVAIQT
jgi:hypothetical protein